jgi:hypothetical protein
VERYQYDGNGLRVAKVGPNATTVYVYDAQQQLVAEYSTSPATSSSACRTCYLSVDHLGSTRLVTDENGNVVARHDFLPFGEEVPAGMASRDNTFASNDPVSAVAPGSAPELSTSGFILCASPPHPAAGFDHRRQLGHTLGNRRNSHRRVRHPRRR